MRDVLTDSAVRVQFAGHETFPLRLLWLKKVHDAVTSGGAQRRTFQEHEAIATFGVGRNMALSMRHWAFAAGMLTDDEAGFRASDLARQLLDDGAADPYLEHPSTLWLVHLALAGRPEVATTFFYAFNLINDAVFDREDLISAVQELGRRKEVRATSETLRRDVDVFLRSYVGRGEAGEDAAEPLLAELGLIRDTRVSGQYEFVRGPKPSLQDGVFAVALGRFWERWHKDSPTLSVEQICYAPGSPGRLFKLDEESVAQRLARIGATTDGALAWTDTAGLRQVVRIEPLIEASLVAKSFGRSVRV